MNHTQIEEYRRKLTEILSIEDVPQRLEPLVSLAREVGASTARFGRTVPDDTNEIVRNVITESEIVQNIHLALYTASTTEIARIASESCNHAAKSCEVAAKNYKVAIWAAVIAAFSALAAWAAVLATSYKQ